MEEILTLVNRYAFAATYNNASKDAAWNTLVSALKQFKNDTYQEGFVAGSSDGDSSD